MLIILSLTFPGASPSNPVTYLVKCIAISSVTRAEAWANPPRLLDLLPTLTPTFHPSYPPSCLPISSSSAFPPLFNYFSSVLTPECHIWPSWLHLPEIFHLTVNLLKHKFDHDKSLLKIPYWFSITYRTKFNLLKLGENKHGKARINQCKSHFLFEQRFSVTWPSSAVTTIAHPSHISPALFYRRCMCTYMCFP